MPSSLSLHRLGSQWLCVRALLVSLPTRGCGCRHDVLSVTGYVHHHSVELRVHCFRLSMTPRSPAPSLALGWLHSLRQCRSLAPVCNMAAAVICTFVVQQHRPLMSLPLYLTVCTSPVMAAAVTNERLPSWKVSACLALQKVIRQWLEDHSGYGDQLEGNEQQH